MAQPHPARGFGRFALRTLVCTVAIIWNAIFLLFMVGEMLLSGGNVTLDARPTHTVATADVLFMLLGFGCSLAAAWSLNTREPR